MPPTNGRLPVPRSPQRDKALADLAPATRTAVSRDQPAERSPGSLGSRACKAIKPANRISLNNELNWDRNWKQRKRNLRPFSSRWLHSRSSRPARRHRPRHWEPKVDDLTRLLQDREASLNQQDELLAHDRDIREVMGARNLYIAEVYDTDEKGATRKPYGRVFYTKEKSLIFYAYDLDQQQAKHAQTFQAWGRRGPDFKQALNLGIFYEDNASKKRWVLKLDDPKTLAQIDAVFVTVEPHGGSDKPSGKPLLFAYLRVNPNHP